MKRKTLIALGIAGAFACTTSSAATFLCAQDEANASSISCAEIPSAVLDSMASAESTWVPAPPFVTYYLVPSGQDEVALVEFWEQTEPSVVAYYFEPAAAAATDLSSPDQWSHSEPRTVTYLSGSESTISGSGTDLSSVDQWQHSEPRTVTYFSSPAAGVDVSGG